MPTNELKQRPWKSGDEFLPYHPQASHIPPQYRDGWNACFASAADWLQKALEERANEIKENAAQLLSFPGMEHESRCRELVALELESLGKMIQMEQLFASKLAVLSKRRPLCWCERCDQDVNNGMSTRMSVCPERGDKRCLRAADHRNECSKA